MTIFWEINVTFIKWASGLYEVMVYASSVDTIPAVSSWVALLQRLNTPMPSVPPAEKCVVGCERHRPDSTSRSKMAVSVFSGVRLLSIGDANGDIQRHSEQQPLRLEVKITQDAALINLSNGELTLFRSCFSDGRPVLTTSANAMQC